MYFDCMSRAGCIKTFVELVKYISELIRQNIVDSKASSLSG